MQCPPERDEKAASPAHHARSLSCLLTSWPDCTTNRFTGNRRVPAARTTPIGVYDSCMTAPESRPGRPLFLPPGATGSALRPPGRHGPDQAGECLVTWHYRWQGTQQYAGRAYSQAMRQQIHLTKEFPGIWRVCMPVSGNPRNRQTDITVLQSNSHTPVPDRVTALPCGSASGTDGRRRMACQVTAHQPVRHWVIGANPRFPLDSGRHARLAGGEIRDLPLLEVDQTQRTALQHQQVSRLKQAVRHRYATGQRRDVECDLLISRG